MRPAGPISTALALLWMGMPGAPRALAQTESTPPPAPPAQTTAPASDRADDERLDRDRFEWGVAAVQGFFDGLGTIGYRRFIRDGGPFQQNLALELQGGSKDYLSEGAFSVLYLFRPLRTVRPEWRVRPLLELGPGAHLVVQVADIKGFDDTGFHTKAYLKMHAYAGVEALFSRRWGVLIRGRLTTPADRPLDYAQAAIFFR